MAMIHQTAVNLVGTMVTPDQMASCFFNQDWTPVPTVMMQRGVSLKTTTQVMDIIRRCNHRASSDMNDEKPNPLYYELQAGLIQAASQASLTPPEQELFARNVDTTSVELQPLSAQLQAFPSTHELTEGRSMVA